MNKIEADKSFPQLKNLTWRSDVFGLTFFMVFAIIWLLIVVENLSNFVVMVASATYYWNNDASTVNDQKDAEVGTAWWITYCNHFGTVAIGSFLCAVIFMLKITVMVIAHYLEEITGDNAVVKCITGCALCFIQCLELITDYITNSAFAYIAVTGDGFCEGAYNAFLLQVSHMGEFAWVLFLTKCVIFLGKVGCVALNIFILDAVLKPMMIGNKTTSMIGPSIIVGLISWVISSIFMGMYETAADTMITCYAIDYEMHNKEPLFGPVTFQENL
jgi:hypothetical protein